MPHTHLKLRNSKTEFITLILLTILLAIHSPPPFPILIKWYQNYQFTLARNLVISLTSPFLFFSVLQLHQSFWTSALLTVLDWIILCCGDLSYALHNVSNLGLYPLCVSNPPCLHSYYKQKCFKTLPKVPWGGNCPQLRATNLYPSSPACFTS